LTSLGLQLKRVAFDTSLLVAAVVLTVIPYLLLMYTVSKKDFGSRSRKRQTMESARYNKPDYRDMFIYITIYLTESCSYVNGGIIEHQ
jgi:hypothetical protein